MKDKKLRELVCDLIEELHELDDIIDSSHSSQSLLSRARDMKKVRVSKCNHGWMLRELDKALEGSDFDHPFLYCPFCGNLLEKENKES